MEISIPLVYDSYDNNSNETLTFKIHASDIYMQLSDSDREFSVKYKDLISVLKIMEFNKE